MSIIDFGLSKENCTYNTGLGHTRKEIVMISPAPKFLTSDGILENYPIGYGNDLYMVG